MSGFREYEQSKRERKTLGEVLGINSKSIAPGKEVSTYTKNNYAKTPDRCLL